LTLLETDLKSRRKLKEQKVLFQIPQHKEPEKTVPVLNRESAADIVLSL
jgi:SET domain-containing protein